MLLSCSQPGPSRLHELLCPSGATVPLTLMITAIVPKSVLLSDKNEEETSPAATSLYLGGTRKTMVVPSWVIGGTEGLFRQN